MTSEKMIKEIHAIKKDIELIKRNMIDADTVLTEKETKEINKAISEYQSGQSISLDEFKKNAKHKSE